MYDIINYWFPIQVMGFTVTPYLQVILAMTLMTKLGFTSGLVRNGISQDENEATRSSIGMNAHYFKHFYEQDRGVQKSSSSTRKSSKNSFKKNGGKKSENPDGNNNNQQPKSAKQGSTNNNDEKRVPNNNNNKKHVASGDNTLKKRRKISLQDLVEIERAKRGKKKKNQ